MSDNKQLSNHFNWQNFKTTYWQHWLKLTTASAKTRTCLLLLGRCARTTVGTSQNAQCTFCDTDFYP